MIGLFWDPYNNIGTIYNGSYPDGTNFTGEDMKPLLSFEYDGLKYKEDMLQEYNIYTTQENKRIPLDRKQIEEIRWFANEFIIPAGHEQGVV